MRYVFPLIFIVVPMVEIALLIKVGQIVGFWPTFGTVVAMAVVGGMVLRQQSLAVVRRAMRAVEQGKPPLAEVFDGACLFLAGGLLLAPGLLTDAAGLLLLVPWIRRQIGRWIFERLFETAVVRIRGTQRDEKGPSPVIDGEFKRIDEKSAGTGRRPDDPRRS